MQCHGVNGLKSFRARRDGKGPIVALALEHPRRRPCPLALRPRTPSRPHTSWPQGHLSLPLPRHPQGFHSPFFLWQRSAHHGQPCPLLSHTVGEHKGERGASYQRGEEKPTRLPREPPGRLARGSRALAASGQGPPSAPAAPAPLSTRLSRQEYWSGLPFLCVNFTFLLMNIQFF